MATSARNEVFSQIKFTRGQQSKLEFYSGLLGLTIKFRPNRSYEKQICPQRSDWQSGLLGKDLQIVSFVSTWLSPKIVMDGLKSKVSSLSSVISCHILPFICRDSQLPRMLKHKDALHQRAFTALDWPALGQHHFQIAAHEAVRGRPFFYFGV